MTRNGWLLTGAISTLAVAELYHGPLGAAEQLERRIESRARAELARNEMTQVRAELKTSPLRRTLLLSGPADDFQRSELVRVLGELPGVDGAEWDPASLPAEAPVR